MADARTEARLARNAARSVAAHLARIEESKAEEKRKKEERRARLAATIPSEEERRQIRLWSSYGMDLDQIHAVMPQYSIYRIRDVLRAHGQQFWEGLR